MNDLLMTWLIHPMLIAIGAVLGLTIVCMGFIIAIYAIVAIKYIIQWIIIGLLYAVKFILDVFIKLVGGKK